jgi:hypothetical protein
MKAWDEIIGVPCLPYDLDERREALLPVYARLAPYIERQEAYARERIPRKSTRIRKSK